MVARPGGTARPFRLDPAAAGPPLSAEGPAGGHDPALCRRPALAGRPLGQHGSQGGSAGAPLPGGRWPGPAPCRPPEGALEPPAVGGAACGAASCREAKVPSRVLPQTPGSGCRLQPVNAKPLRPARRPAARSQPLAPGAGGAGPRRHDPGRARGATGLSAATVSNMVRELAADRLRRAGSEHAQRPARRTGRSPPGGGSWPASRSVTATSGWPSPTRLRVLAQQRMPLQADHQPTRAWSGRRGCCGAGRAAGARRGDRPAVGFGLPAPVDSCSGEVGSEAILPGWRGVPSPRRCRRACARRSGWTTRRTWRRWANYDPEPARGEERVLHQGLVRRGRRPGPGRRPVPGERRYGGGDRSPDHRRERPHLPVRQPRLPGHVRRLRALLGTLAVVPRPADACATCCSVPPRATPAAAASSRTRAATSASPRPVWSTCSTPRSSSSEASSPGRRVVLGPLRDAIERCAIPARGERGGRGRRAGRRGRLLGALSVAAQLHRHVQPSVR